MALKQGDTRQNFIKYIPIAENLCFIFFISRPRIAFFWAHHQASKVTVLGEKKIGISTFFARVLGQNVSLPPNLH